MDVFDFAMKMELDGKGYYEKMAAQTSITGLRGIFLMLAGDEQKHYEIFQALKQNSSPVMTQSTALQYAKTVFENLRVEKDFSRRAVTTNDIELEAYEHAMKLEDESVRLYSDAMKKEQNEEVRSLLRQIVEEERKHYNILENLYDFVLRPHYFLQWREFTNLTELM